MILLQNTLVVLVCGALLGKTIRHMWSFTNVKEPVKVLITGAAGMLLFNVLLSYSLHLHLFVLFYCGPM